MGRELGSTQMYQVEHHILECDLCGEAVDGLEYQTAPDIARAFASVQERLELKKPKEFWALEFKKSRILLVGLGVIILSLVAYLVMGQLIQNPSLQQGEQKVAYNQEPQTPVKEKFTMPPVEQDIDTITEVGSEPEQANQQTKPQAIETKEVSQTLQQPSYESPALPDKVTSSTPEAIETPGPAEDDAGSASDSNTVSGLSKMAVGQILDAKTKLPLSNVFIKIDATGEQVITDDQGYYTISLKQEQAIVTLFYRGASIDKMSIDVENQLRVDLDLDRKEIYNISFTSKANRFK